MQNWNDGKAQEFKDRKVYDVFHSKFHGKAADLTGENGGAREDVRQPEVKNVEGALLFTTKTCPNCVIAKRTLEEAGIPYQVVDAQEQKELAKAYGVMQAPTLVISGDEGVEKLAGAGSIKRYADAHAVQTS